MLLDTKLVFQLDFLKIYSLQQFLLYSLRLQYTSYVTENKYKQIWGLHDNIFINHLVHTQNGHINLTIDSLDYFTEFWKIDNINI